MDKKGLIGRHCAVRGSIWRGTPKSLGETAPRLAATAGHRYNAPSLRLEGPKRPELMARRAANEHSPAMAERSAAW